MALAWMDPCQHGANASQDNGWSLNATQIAYSAAASGPFGVLRWLSTPGTALQKTLPSNIATLQFGYWFKVTQASSNANWDLQDGASVQCRISQIAGGQLTLRNGTAGTVLLTSSVFGTGWVWVWWEIPFGNSVTVKLYIDDVLDQTVSGVDTTTTANNFMNALVSSQGNNSWGGYSLILVCDSTGAQMNAHLPPQLAGVQTIAADSATNTGFTANTGTKHGAVDETPTPNDDTDYISSNTVGAKYSGTLTAVPVGISQITAFKIHGRTRRDDAGPHTHRHFIYNGTSQNNRPTVTTPASYASESYDFDLNPFTSAVPTPSQLNAFELGIEVVS